MKPRKYWSELPNSYKEELKALWQSSSEVYQDNYDGFSLWLQNEYNIVLDNNNNDNKDNTNKDTIIIGVGVVLFIITIIFITTATYNSSTNKDNNYYDNSNYNDDYNSIESAYYCDSDYTLINNQCYKKDIIDATKEYQCYYGTLKGSECITEYSSPAFEEKTCPVGYILYGPNCVDFKTDHTIRPTIKYKCYTGTLRGSECITEFRNPASIVYTCPIGYIQKNTICEKEIIIPANIR